MRIRIPRRGRALGAAFVAVALAASIATPAIAHSVLEAKADSANTTPGVTVKLHVLKNDHASEGAAKDALRVLSVGTPSHGTATVYEDRYVKYTPAASFTGTDSFTYTISDGTGTDSATITVKVKDKADKPAATEKDKTKDKAKDDAKESAKKAEAAAKVTATCAAHSASTPAVASLCALYTGGQLPAWAAESVGQVIVKLAPKVDPVLQACEAAGNTDTVEALCRLYEGNRLPPGIHKQIGKFILELRDTGAVAPVKLKP